MSTASSNQTAEDASGAALRAVMRQVPAPVTVVTGRSAEGQPFGITIGSFTSVSLRPPLISFNVSEEAMSYEWLAEAEHFAVHLLSRRQMPLAVRFADPGRPPKRQFEGVGWRDGPGGVPVLAGALAVLHCRPHARFRAGDSDIVVGRVTAVANAALRTDPKGVPAAKPLLYHQRGYRTVEAKARTASAQDAEERSSAPEKRSARGAPETPAPKSAKS